MPGIDGFAIRPALGKVKKRARLERDEDPFVDKADVVDDATHVPKRVEIVVVLENRREADHVLFDRYRCKLRPLGQQLRIRPPREQFDHGGERIVRGAMKPVELPPTGRALPGPISAHLQEVRKDRAEFGTHHLDTEHDIEILGSPERKPGFAEKDVAGLSDPLIFFVRNRC